MNDILIISTNNICRGPMLEGFTRERLRREAPGASVASRGINVVAPSRAAAPAVQTMKNDFGVDLTAHIARPLSIEDMRGASAVLVMSAAQKSYVAAVYPDYGGKIAVVTGPGGEDVEPAMGEDIMLYKLCAEMLRGCADSLDLPALLGKQAAL